MMNVYIVFGDTPRSDGENIEGIFLNENDAENHKKTMEKYRDDTTYSIEKHEVY